MTSGGTSSRSELGRDFDDPARLADEFLESNWVKPGFDPDREIIARLWRHVDESFGVAYRKQLGSSGVATRKKVTRGIVQNVLCALDAVLLLY